MDLVFLLIMICLANDEGVTKCEKNLIDQFENVERCVQTKEVIQWELAPHLKSNIGVTLWCSVNRNEIIK
jgi:hypothetical protein